MTSKYFMGQIFGEAFSFVNGNPFKGNSLIPAG
jgi:hypothetical protein